MTDLIDLNDERARRDAPDRDCIRHDEYGRPLYLFTASYMRGDAEYSLEFWAYNFDDAQATVDGMNSGITLDGQRYGTVPL